MIVKFSVCFTVIVAVLNISVVWTNSLSESRCLHGGTPVNSSESRIESCNCINTTYDGPNCEVLKRTFATNSTESSYEISGYYSENNSSYLHISWEFIQENFEASTYGLISWKLFSVVIEDGFLKFQSSDQCSSSIILKTEGANAVNDNYWHRIDVIINQTQVTVMLDLCKQNEQNLGNCYKTTTLSSPLKINTTDKFHFGFVYDQFPCYQNSFKKFSGCQKNLRINGKLIDLYKNVGENRCLREDISCGIVSGNPHCGENSVCVARLASNKQSHCICLPGKMSSNNINCFNNTQQIHLKGADISWVLTQSYDRLIIQKRKFSIQMLFRTKSSNSQLFYIPFTAASSNNYQYLSLKITSGKVEAILDNTDSSQTIRVKIGSIDVNDGIWHKINLQLSLNTLELGLDHASLPSHYSFLMIPLESQFNQLIFPFSEKLYAGKDPKGQVPNYEGCLNDIRLNGNVLPLQKTDDFESVIINGTFDYGCDNPAGKCDQTACPDFYDCQSGQWGEKPKCICNGTHIENATVNSIPCYKSDCEIAGKICKNNSTCQKYSSSWEEYNNGTNATCVCLDGYTGELCEVLIPGKVTEKEPDEFAWYWILLIILLLLLLLILLLLILFCCCCGGVLGAGDADQIHNEFAKENMIYYNDGAGEKDFDGDIDYNLLIGALKPKDDEIKTLPDDRRPYPPNKDEDKPVTGGPNNDKLPWKQPDFYVPNIPFNDNTLEYAYEGSLSNRPASLSTVPSRDESDQMHNFDHLQNWGPKFDRLSRLYNP